jgi:hypothetical protein
MALSVDLHICRRYPRYNERLIMGHSKSVIAGSYPCVDKGRVMRCLWLWISCETQLFCSSPWTGNWTRTGRVQCRSVVSAVKTSAFYKGMEISYQMNNSQFVKMYSAVKDVINVYSSNVHIHFCSCSWCSWKCLRGSYFLVVLSSKPNFAYSYIKPLLTLPHMTASVYRYDSA